MNRLAIAIALAAGFALPAVAQDTMKSDVNCDEFLQMNEEDQMTALGAIHDEMETMESSGGDNMTATSGNTATTTTGIPKEGTTTGGTTGNTAVGDSSGTDTTSGSSSTAATTTGVPTEGTTTGGESASSAEAEMAEDDDEMLARAANACVENPSQMVSEALKQPGR